MFPIAIMFDDTATYANEMTIRKASVITHQLIKHMSDFIGGRGVRGGEAGWAGAWGVK